MKYEYVQPINSHLFCVYDTQSGLDFYVYLDDDSKMELAMEIANLEINLWITEEDSYYEGIGYIECIENAFANYGIEADFYDKEMVAIFSHLWVNGDRT